MTRLTTRSSLLSLGVASLLVSCTSNESARPDRQAGSPWAEAGDLPTPIGRAEARLLEHRDEHGRIPDNALMRAKAALRSRPTTGTIAGLDSTKWTSIGPGNIGGRVRAIAVHPTQPTTIFIGSVSGGIWRSLDDGRTWAAVDDNMGNLAITSIQIDSTNPRVMYAGTGEGFPGPNAIRGAGIFKSTDGGTTWTQLAATATVDFHYVSRVALSADGRTLLASTRKGIFRSTNGGSNWTRTTPTTSFRCEDVKFRPGSNTIAVAHRRENARTATLNQSLYSVDGGATWRVSNLNQSTSFFPFGRTEFAWHAGYTGSGNGVVYALEDRFQNDTRVHRSVDGGATYTQVSNQRIVRANGWYNLTLWVAPYPRDARHDNDVVIAGAISLFRSTNGGANFTDITRGHVDYHALVPDPRYNGTTNRRVWVGNDGGVWRLEDAVTASRSAGWSNQNNDLRITQFYGGHRNERTGRVMGGCQDVGIDAYDPAFGPNQWNVAAFGDGGYVATDPGRNIFYSETQWAHIRRSTDGGNTAVAIYGPGKGAPYEILDAKQGGSNFIAPLVMDPNNARRLLVGCKRLWRTNDADAALTATTGPRWEAIKPAISDSISAIGVRPGNSNVIWVGHNNGALFFTSNGTATNPTWTAKGGLPGRLVKRIVFDPANPQRMFITYTGFASDNLWTSTNGGSTWSAVTLPVDAPVRDIEVHPTKSSWLYLATEVGLLASEDNGRTWSGAATPADVSIDEMFWSSGDLYLVTHGRGFFHQKPIDSSGPDLVVSAFSVPAGNSWQAGGQQFVDITVKNIGNVRSPASLVTVQHSASRSVDLTRDDMLIRYLVPALAPNESFRLNPWFRNPYCWSRSGSFYMSAFADGLDGVTETDESNNATVIATPRPRAVFTGNERHIQYMDPRARNDNGPWTPEAASYSAAKGMSTRICATAPQDKGHFCLIVLSSSGSGFVPDALTNIGLGAGFFAPFLAQTSPSTGLATITQSMPRFTIGAPLPIYLYSAWFTPQLVFDGFGGRFPLRNFLRP